MIFPLKYFKYILPFSFCLQFLLNNHLLIVWDFPHMLLVALPLLHLIFFVLIFIWLVCILACFSLGLSCMGLSVFLDLIDYFLSHVWDVFTYYLFKYFSGPFSLSSPSGTPIMQILVFLMLSQSSLKLSSFFCFSHFFLHSITCRWG